LESKKVKLESSKIKSRSGHSATLISEDKIIIWGGRKSSDIDIINTKQLTSSNRLFSAKEEPIGNANHIANFLMNKFIVIFGGIVDSMKPQNSAHILDTNNMRWTLDVPIEFSMENNNSKVPTMYAHSAVKLSANEIWIFGGYVDGKISNRTFKMTLFVRDETR
jgi:hypothetical protein